MDINLIKLKCIKGYCQNGALLLPDDVIEVELITTDKNDNIDVDIKVIVSKFSKDLETSISGTDMVNHFVYYKEKHLPLPLLD